MSERDAVLTERLLEYAAERAAADGEFERALKAAALEAGLPQISVSPFQAALMQVLLRLHGARDVVEIGTLGGYSAIRMARALPPGGRVRTIEVDPAHAAFAREWIARSDVAGAVEVLEGPGVEILAGFAEGSADAAFIDADKESYPLYLRECIRIVRPGGLVLADNAFAFGRVLDEGDREPSVVALRAFNEELAGSDELQGTIVPVGDGLWVAVRKGKPA